MSPFGSMVITTSVPATASAALSNTATPTAVAAATAAGTGSNPRTLCPAATRFADIGPPMLPNPRNAIWVIFEPFLNGGLRGSEPRGLGPTDDHPHDFVGAFQNSVHP